MSMTATPRATVDPVVGIFDDVGSAEHAVHDLHAAGFERDAVSMEWEEVEVPTTAPPAPRSYDAPFAFVCALLGGVIPALIAAYFAPHTVTLYGFGWRVSPVITLALVGGTLGWVTGAILGFGHVGPEETAGLPEPVTLQAPFVVVSVLAPSRPGEARAILRRAGVREIQGGDRARVPAAQAVWPTTVRATPQQRQTVRMSARSRQRVASATPAGRHERLLLGPHGANPGRRRAGIALVLAGVAGVVLALLRRRRD